MGFIENTHGASGRSRRGRRCRSGLVLFGTLAVLVDGEPERLTESFPGTLTAQIGTRVSNDGGHTFPAFGTADQVVSTGATPETIDRMARSGHERRSVRRCGLPVLGPFPRPTDRGPAPLSLPGWRPDMRESRTCLSTSPWATRR